MGSSAGQVPSWYVPVVTLVATFGAAYANYRTQQWRARIDRLGAAVDGLCNEINAAADVATQYWVKDWVRMPATSEVKAAEFGILGRQARIQQIIGAVRMQDAKLDLAPVDELTADFFDALTGGDFQVTDHPPDPARATTVQDAAAKLNGALRQSLNRRTQMRF